MKKVCVCIPTITKPYPQTLASLEAEVPLLEAAGWDHYMVPEVGNPYISAARAKMLRKALDAGADVVVFIDHDVSWRPGDLVKLINTPGDVVAGTYRFKAEQISYMGTLHSLPDGRPACRADGCIKAHLVPAGFLKITKEGVDRFMSAYPDLCYGEKYRLSVDLFNHGAHKGVWWGEDYAFSRRWGEMGGDIWLVPDLSLDHNSADQCFRGNYHDYLLSLHGQD